MILRIKNIFLVVYFFFITFFNLSCHKTFQEDPWNLPEPLIVLTKSEKEGLSLSSFEDNKSTLHYLKSSIYFPETLSSSLPRGSNKDGITEVDQSKGVDEETDIEVESFCDYNGKGVNKENIFFSLKEFKEVFIYQLLPFEVFLNSVEIIHCRFIFVATNSRNSSQIFEISRTPIRIKDKSDFSSDSSGGSHQQKSHFNENEDYKIKIKLQIQREADQEAFRGFHHLTIPEDQLFNYQFVDQSVYNIITKEQGKNSFQTVEWRLQCEDFYFVHEKTSKSVGFDQFDWIVEGENILSSFLDERVLGGRNFSLKQNCLLFSYKNNMTLSISPIFSIQLNQKIREPLLLKNFKEEEEESHSIKPPLTFSSHKIREVKVISPVDFLDLSQIFHFDSENQINVGYQKREKMSLEVFTQCYLFTEEGKDSRKDLTQVSGVGPEKLKLFKKKTFFNPLEPVLSFFKMLPLEVIFKSYLLQLQSNGRFSFLDDDFFKDKIQCDFNFKVFAEDLDKGISFNMKGINIHFHNLRQSRSHFCAQIDDPSCDELIKKEIPIFTSNSWRLGFFHDQKNFFSLLSWWEFLENEKKENGDLSIKNRKKDVVGVSFLKDAMISYSSFSGLKERENIKTKGHQIKIKFHCDDFNLGLKKELYSSHFLKRFNWYPLNQEAHRENYERGSIPTSYFVDSLKVCGIFLLAQSEMESEEGGVQCEDLESIGLNRLDHQEGRLNVVENGFRGSDDRGSEFESCEIIGFSSPFVIAPPQKTQFSLEKINGQSFEMSGEIQPFHIFDFSNNFPIFQKIIKDSQFRFNLDVTSQCFLNPDLRESFSQRQTSDRKNKSSKTFHKETSFTLNERGKTGFSVFDLLPLKILIHESRSVSCKFNFKVKIAGSFQGLIDLESLKSNFEILISHIQLNKKTNTLNMLYPVIALPSEGGRLEGVREVGTLGKLSSKGREGLNKGTREVDLDFFSFPAFPSGGDNFLFKNQGMSQFISLTGDLQGEWNLECDRLELKNIKTHLEAQQQERIKSLSEDIFLLKVKGLIFEMSLKVMRNSFFSGSLENRKRDLQRCRLFFQTQNQVRFFSSAFDIQFSEPIAKVEFLNPLKASDLVAPFQRTKRCHYFVDRSYKRPPFDRDNFDENFTLGEIRVSNPSKKELYFKIPNPKIEVKLERISNLYSFAEGIYQTSYVSMCLIDFPKTWENNPQEIKCIREKGPPIFFKLPAQTSFAFSLYILPTILEKPYRSNPTPILARQRGLYSSLSLPFEVIQTIGGDQGLKEGNIVYRNTVLQKDRRYLIEGCVSRRYYSGSKMYMYQEY